MTPQAYEDCYMQYHTSSIRRFPPVVAAEDVILDKRSDVRHRGFKETSVLSEKDFSAIASTETGKHEGSDMAIENSD